MKPWEAFGVETPDEHPPIKYLRIFLIVVTIVNLIVVAMASTGGWVTIGMLYYYGPIANVTLSVISLLLTNSLRDDNPELSLGKHLFVSISVPIAAIFIDELIIAIMIATIGISGGC